MKTHLRAFSLVETIVVAGLLSTVLLFVMALIPSFKLSNKRAALELQASSLAQSALENARSGNFADLATSPPRLITVEGVEFTETLSVTDSPSGYAKTVRVTVEWGWQEKKAEVFRESILCRIPRS